MRGSSYINSPSLMVGLSGIGYGLMRRACPDQVPSILILAPPFRAGFEV
ncbi:MAG: hypothetical protein H0U86_17070 [Chloroflexi bacterium]|nr:hypothetical protein [Chloroflexota bacterium]